jgi:hypothetical protein
MSFTLGINPITWTHDHIPELGGDIPLLSQRLSRCSLRWAANMMLCAEGHGGTDGNPRAPLSARPVLSAEQSGFSMSTR